MAAKITIVSFNCEICKKDHFLPPGHLKQSHTDFCQFEKQFNEASNDEQKMLLRSNFMYKIEQNKAQLLNAVNTCTALEVQINMQTLNKTQIILENEDLLEMKKKKTPNGDSQQIQRCVKKVFTKRHSPVGFFKIYFFTQIWTQ